VRRLRVAAAIDLEGDIGGSGGFDLERGAREMIVLAEEVIGGLAKVLL
jgi:hypothetical protein